MKLTVVIGLGKMGTEIVMNLLRSGRDVTIYNRTAEKTRALESRGATVALTLQKQPHAKTSVPDHCSFFITTTIYINHLPTNCFPAIPRLACDSAVDAWAGNLPPNCFAGSR
jgi:shikimate 5-dehydrogenase